MILKNYTGISITRCNMSDKSRYNPELSVQFFPAGHASQVTMTALRNSCISFTL